MASALRGRKVRQVAGCAILLAAALVAPPQLRAEDAAPAITETVPTGGPFSLMTDQGAPVTDQSYRGRWLLIYFGYTYCPDVCPTALSEISTAMEKLGPLADKVQPIFITIDPQRDTMGVLAQYVRTFDRRLVGLTGSAEQITAVARLFHVMFEREDKPDGNYLFDHSSWIYVMDRDGKFVKILPSSLSGEEIADDMTALMAAAAP
jgi:protein SCO1